MNRLRLLVVTGLGTSALPIAPGTWGSAAVCVIFLAVAWASGGRGHCTSGSMLALCLLASVGCVALGRFAETTFGRKDPSQCTLDEWAGQALTLTLLPLHSPLGDWPGRLIVTAAGFVAFRAFDILKPPPARQLEKLPFGWGVLLDDLAAAVYANISCQILFRTILKW